MLSLVNFLDKLPKIIKKKKNWLILSGQMFMRQNSFNERDFELAQQKARIF